MRFLGEGKMEKKKFKIGIMGSIRGRFVIV